MGLLRCVTVPYQCKGRTITSHAAEDRLGAEVRAWAKAHGADVDKVDLDAGDG